MLLNKNEEVCFLYKGTMRTGTVNRVSEFEDLIGIECDGELIFANRKFVAKIDSKFCVVQADNLEYTNDSVVRFDFTTYKRRNKTWEAWVSPEGWIKESFDPYELRMKATVYGLEL